MVSVGGLDSAFLATPTHNGRVRCDAALEDLVPTDYLLAFRIDEFFDAANEVALYFVLVLEVLAFF